MPIRLAYFSGLVLVIVLLLTSVYLQVYEGIMPCPLCSLQRMVFGVLGLVCIAGLLLSFSRIARWLIHICLALISVLGILLAGRQIWMQHFPASGSNECGVSLQYMVQAFPLNQVLQKIIFEGSVECTKRGWEFLHLNMAEWAFLWFTLFLLMAIYLSLKELSANAA